MNGINSLVGHTIFEEIRNDNISVNLNEAPNLFFSSINHYLLPTNAVPESPLGTIKILDFVSKPKAYKKAISECDTFIIDLVS